MSLKPGFKQTEVGVIPDDWEEVRLGDIGYIFGGLTGKSSEDFGSGNANYITFMNVISNVVSKESGVEKVSVGVGEHQSAVLPGDVLFNGSSETPEEVGFGSVVPEALAGTYLNSFCFGFRPNKDSDLDSKFFAYLTRSSLGREIIRPMAQGSTRYNLAKTNLLNGRFPRPLVKEQKAIAEALSDVDALINSLEALLTKKRNIKTGVMQELLTGKTRLPGFSGGWKTKRLDEVAAIDAGLNKDLSMMGRGVLYVTVKDLYQGSSINIETLGRISASRDEVSRYGLVNGDIVFNKSSVKREGIGYPSRFIGSTEHIIYSGFTFRARPLGQLIDSTFLFYSLRSAPVRKWVVDNSQASALTNLNARIAAAIPLLVPPSLTEQKMIGDALSDMDAEIFALEKRLAKTRDLKQGMAQELLSGRTRLV
jgi:type I restriction enzyme S subunit